MEKNVRDAAAALKKAIDEARAAGYRIDWPANSDGLVPIPISETAKVRAPEPTANPAPKTFGKLNT